MAVPKRKTSHSKKNKRRAHDALMAPNVISCPECGMYRGRKVINVETE
jgi:large subunit ribosomal protein L32